MKTIPLFVLIILTASAVIAEWQCPHGKLLVYYCVDSGYYDLFRLSFGSLLSVLSPKEHSCVGVVVLVPQINASTAHEFRARLREEKQACWSVVPVVFPLSATGVAVRDEETLGRFRVFEVPDTANYTVALYVDADTLFVKSPLSLMLRSGALKNGQVYAVPTGTSTSAQFNSRYFGLHHYSSQQVDGFIRDGVKPMNSGVFCFNLQSHTIAMMRDLYYFAMREIFAGTKHFVDQSFFNHYLLTHRLGNTTFLKGHVQMASGKVGETVAKSSTVVLHFIAAGLGSHQYKLQRMQAYLDNHHTRHLNWKMKECQNKKD
mmetsp:Transcript_45842/g.115447  ORF Transcript_45842/g.115447 Transcript_45842/m.115447 type:complete len:317 (+) Transcript_45842:47-997(+)|eukprot:CAMPEP_0177630654 /NCGR_PEP_ID=MMETSP0447-20121125/1328_1 /TAXON_ID=0 /ORGANISM="Stygamoeba regulata, Strain BSH-02190019" /LENGTH=316 /DNA_ID=CAMNT_0019132079 /DNA_START=47 /DNA_END=997 /DNA_ORIENTATION=-